MSQYRLAIGPMTPAVRVLLICNALIFILRSVVMSKTGNAFDILFGLSEDFYVNGFFWQIVTYMFLHGGFWHLLFNMLVLYFMGTETERAIGTRHFLVLYFLSGMLGGVGWLLLSSGGICIGASGAVFGVLGAYAALFPNRLITVLVFFIIPITLRAWVLVAILSAFEFFLMVTHLNGTIAHSAHLAGVLAGAIYAWVVFRRGPIRIRILRDRKTPDLKILRREEAPTFDAAEVDRILDKIAHEGMASLTTRERRILQQASQAQR